MALEYVVTKRVFGFDKDKKRKVCSKVGSFRQSKFFQDVWQGEPSLWSSPQGSGSGRQRSCRYDGGGH